MKLGGENVGIPNTLGVLRTSLDEMEIGDYIPCKYTTTSSGLVGTFSELGSSSANEIPINGTSTPNGTFYFIKVDKGILIADRVIQHSIYWTRINEAMYADGAVTILNNQACLIRLLTGGIGYLNAEGKLSLTDVGLGIFPTYNEWDKYIIKSNLNGKVIPGDDNVWHINAISSFCKETPANGVEFGSVTATQSYRVTRGGSSSFGISSTSSYDVGFRPALEYIEPDGSSKQTTLWY